MQLRTEEVHDDHADHAEVDEIHDDHDEADDDHDDHDADGGDTLILRIVAVFASAASTGVGLAVFFPKRAEAFSTETLLCIRAASAGAMLSVAIVHILPEAGHSLEKVTAYPLAATFFLLGVMLAYALETLSRGHSHDQVNEETTSPSGQELTNAPASCERMCCKTAPISTISSSKLAVESIELGCSVHCILLGLSLGLQTEMANAVVLFAVMVIHQFLEAACLGHLLASLASRTETIALCLLIVGSMPAGIIIGLIISETANGSEVASKMAPITASISCVAGGMLLFSSLVGLLAVDAHRPSVKASKELRCRMLASLVLGAAAMSALSAGEAAGGGHAGHR